MDVQLSSHATLIHPSDVPPEWVQLIPAGISHGRDGRGPYNLKDVPAVIAATKAHFGSADIPVDYDHQIMYAKDNGQPAPAAGWIKDFSTRPDGLWGRVEWTERAAAHLKNREFRYLSPSFTIEKTAP